jgi:hypothetical protein
VGRYDVARCDANGVPPSLAQDPCNALNTAALACEAYQCDGATGTCRLGRLGPLDRGLELDLQPGTCLPQLVEIGGQILTRRIKDAGEVRGQEKATSESWGG